MQNQENQQESNDIINLNYEELQFILAKIVSSNPNKEEMTHCNIMIKKYSKNILSVEGYLLQIKTNENFKIRQLSAILLNRKLEKHWQKMEDSIQVQLKKLIIEIFFQEKHYLVLKAISNLIYRIAKLNLINQEWNDLLDFIFTDPAKYSTEQAYLFELNLYIISELIESCSHYIKHKLLEIKNILMLALTMGSQRMKENSTKCLGNLVRSLDKGELEIFKELIPCIFKEIKNFTGDTILHIYETFCDFHLNSLVFFELYFDQIIPMTLEFLQSIELNGNTKLVLSEFLLMISECKRKIFTKNDCYFLKMTLELGFKLACSSEESSEINTDELSGKYLLFIFRLFNWNENY